MVKSFVRVPYVDMDAGSVKSKCLYINQFSFFRTDCLLTYNSVTIYWKFPFPTPPSPRTYIVEGPRSVTVCGDNVYFRTLRLLNSLNTSNVSIIFLRHTKSK